MKVSKSEYLRIAGNSSNKWYCSRTDCIEPDKNPQALVSKQLSSVIGKLDELLIKVNKIDGISKDIADIKSEIASINSQVSALEPRVSDVEAKLIDISSGVVCLESKITTQANIIADISKRQDSCTVESILEESSDRLRRSCNLIVYNLPESNSKELDSRVRYDTEKVEVMIRTFCPSQVVLNVKCHRIGATSGKSPRPLRVILPTNPDVQNFMKNFKKDDLASIDPILADVTVSRDRSPRERDYLNVLREQLKRRSESGEEGLTIKYVNGTPKIVKHVPKNGGLRQAVL